MRNWDETQHKKTERIDHIYRKQMSITRNWDETRYKKTQKEQIIFTENKNTPLRTKATYDVIRH